MFRTRSCPVACFACALVFSERFRRLHEEERSPGLVDSMQGFSEVHHAIFPICWRFQALPGIVCVLGVLPGILPASSGPGHHE